MPLGGGADAPADAPAEASILGDILDDGSGLELIDSQIAAETVRAAPAASPSPAVHSLVRASTSRALGPAPRASARSSPRRRARRYMVPLEGRFGAETSRLPLPTSVSAPPGVGMLPPHQRGCAGRLRRRRRAPDAHLRTRRVCANMAAFRVVLSRVRVYLVNPCFQIASYTPSTQPPQPKAEDWPRGRSPGAAKS